ncbi:MAG: hypothetical protein KatS3mg124_0460 [Porticoccaceae bacterium]|nr:MAG: hypothetical protein KatS3mg124_0460 [Porticoccaceae bacterium]
MRRCAGNWRRCAAVGCSTRTWPREPPRRPPPRSLVRSDPALGYRLLDPTVEINRRPLLLLEARDALAEGLLVSGALTAVADWQESNRTAKFGYLMRHPTAANQRTRHVSEAVLHSAQLGLAAALGDWLTGYAEFLYHPGQSFGAGTLTSIERNQVELRRGWVLWGDLERFPVYGLIGKVEIPFALTDTVNPFTASTVWHAFGGLAFGAQMGLRQAGFDLRLMAVQGGAQFRAANTSVDDSAVPSRLDNFAADLSWRGAVGGGVLTLGGSWLRGSAYCQEFPITHFAACRDENPARAFYGRFDWAGWRLQGEWAQTLDHWPGTFNPDLPQFGASRVTSWAVGARRAFSLGPWPAAASVEFSRFAAGPDGAPWERQDQWVAGLAAFPLPSVKVFGEFVRTEGYAPLNFLTGGNLPAGQAVSDRDAHSHVWLIGTNLAF